MPTVTAARLATLLGPEPLTTPAYRDLTDRIRALVIDGRVPDGIRLPSERELATALGVSRTTTTRVYAELRDAGLLTSRRGSGSIVHVPFTESHVSSLIATPGQPGTIAMTYAAPGGSPGLRHAFETALERLPGLLATTGYLPDGLPALRELLAQRYTDRSLPTTPDQIVVTNGAMGAISLVSRALLRPGTRAVVEGLSYPHAYDALTAAGARLTPVAVTEDPWDTTALASVLTGRTHTLAYLIPDFHNPTGLVMDADRRATWARLLRRHDVTPLVDESLREVNLDQIDLPPSFATHDPRAIVVGSASKQYWGGLRLGWARVPHTSLTRLLQSRMTLDLGSSAFEQLVLVELLTSGEGVTHRRDLLRTGRAHLLAALARELPDVHPTHPAGGLSTWLTLPGRFSTRLVAAAARHGLQLTPGPRFYAAAGGEQHLRIPYSAPPAVLDDAIDRLRRAYHEVTHDTRDTTPTPDTRIDLIA